MRYHNITKTDMLNGTGIRVVLWVSGCVHKCKGCHNKVTWDKDNGIEFDQDAINEIMNELKHDYVSGLTLSGGDPLYDENSLYILSLVIEVKKQYPHKNIWIYTGYTFEDIFKTNALCNVFKQNIILECDVLVDGKFIEELKDLTLPWIGSSNQRVIDIKKTREKGEIVLWKC